MYQGQRRADRGKGAGLACRHSAWHAMARSWYGGCWRWSRTGDIQRSSAESGECNMTRRHWTLMVVVFSASIVEMQPARGTQHTAGLRTVVPLDGTWQVAQGSFDQRPERFEATVPVPGLVDMAQPPFEHVGTPASNSLRQAFWYRRTFTLDGPAPASARLKLGKAMFGTKVFINGQSGGPALAVFHTCGVRCARVAAPGRRTERSGHLRRGASNITPQGNARRRRLREDPLHARHLRLRRADSLRPAAYGQCAGCAGHRK